MAVATTKVLIAFDKFKDSMTAATACNAAAAAIWVRRPDWVVDLCPFTDGGDGFESLLTSASHGWTVTETVDGPRGAPVSAPFGLVTLGAIPQTAQQLLGWASLSSDSLIAIIGMASASGLALLRPEERNPWLTSSRGLGQLIRAAMKEKVKGIVLGLGGSATNDLALGALSALGYEFRSAAGNLIESPVPETWSRLSTIVAPEGESLPPIRIACDVDNPLLGPKGATAIYGPQKGLKPDDILRLDRDCSRIANLLCALREQPATLQLEPGSGAAGGAAFGLRAGAGATLVSGTELVSAWLSLEDRIAAASVVITGEGRFDQTSLDGKGPGVLARRALALGKEVHVFAGAIAAEAPGITLHTISPAGLPLTDALARGRQNLERSVLRAF